MATDSFAIRLMERGLLPDFLIQKGIRGRLAERLVQEAGRDPAAFLGSMRSGPVAVDTGAANSQHYEVPASFFETVLGPRLKYSSCYWPAGVDTLAAAEESMLALCCERAGLSDGMDILELGCGWGSLTLYMAEKFPQARITAISNSASQAAFIRARAKERGLHHVAVHTCDINVFWQSPDSYDRVMSVEMFEHCRNWGELTRRVATWLRPEGRCFIHVFTHRDKAYPFEVDGNKDWMARYFFTGGIMPSHDLFERLDGALSVAADWKVNGCHYGRTLYAWLALQDKNKAAVLKQFREVYGADAAVWFQRWRVFWMASGELFNYAGGEEWSVSHYLLQPR